MAGISPYGKDQKWDILTDSKDAAKPVDVAPKSIRTVSQETFAKTERKAEKNIKLHLWAKLAGYIPKGFAKTLSKILVETKLVEHISAEYVHRLSSKVIPHLSPEQLKEMSPEDFAHLDARQLNALPSEYFDFLSIEQLSALGVERLNSIDKQLGTKRLQVMAEKFWKMGNLDEKLDGIKLETALLNEAGKREWVANEGEKIDFLLAQVKDMNPEALKMWQDLRLHLSPDSQKELQETFDATKSQTGTVEVKLGDQKHNLQYGFGRDIARADWNVNGKEVYHEKQKLIEYHAQHFVASALYDAFENNLECLTNFEKIAYQGILAGLNKLIRGEVLAHRPDLVTFNNGRYTYSVETLKDELILRVAVPIYFKNENAKITGELNADMYVRISKQDIQKADFSHAQIIYRLGPISASE